MCAMDLSYFLHHFRSVAAGFDNSAVCVHNMAMIFAIVLLLDKERNILQSTNQ